ncbi:MAG TPA: SRPBCC family protein [Acidimicrobiales bacterium]|nr:SRPBCC family protein [Acidimicrobiales bacterium]
MATIRRTIPVDRPAAEVWDAVADPGAVHDRLARGFVTDTELDGDVRTVTFDGGVVARELIVSVDPGRRRLAYSVIESPLGLRHHHATFQVVGEGDTCSLEWVADVSPDTAAAAVEAMVDLGCAAMQRTLSGTRVPAEHGSPGRRVMDALVSHFAIAKRPARA